MNPYTAMALQVACHAINRAPDTASARASIQENVSRIAGQVRAARRFQGDSLKLVVLPEYVLTGFPMGESFPNWIERACITTDGPELAELAAVAEDTGVWVCINAYDTDEDFPGLYFQSTFVLDEDGQVALRYRRLNSMFAPTPHDVWSAYLEREGLDGVFPVADSPLGRLAAVASEEILYPEIARAAVLRGGAEVLLHPTSEVGSPAMTPKAIAKRARAVENLAYVVSSNTARLEGTDIPSGSTDAMSVVIDPEGRVLAEAGPGESIVATAEIDIEGLRRRRRTPRMSNLLARQRLELFAPVYAGEQGYPADTLAGVAHPDREHFLDVQRQTIERRTADGRL